MTIRGISFPFRKDGGVFPAKDTDSECIKNNILALFSCERYARVMRPELGSDVTLYVFDSIDPLLEARLQRAIRGTIARGEPRASVVNIEFAQEGTLITATVVYQVNGIKESITIDVGSKTN